jgi:hypothetical protein
MLALFNDSISAKWFIRRLIGWEDNEYKVGKELKGSSCNHFSILYQHSPERTEESHINS